MRIVLKRILESALEVNVVETIDSNSATKMYKEEKPDLVTIDINLPSTDGITCMKGILKINHQAKVIMVSAVDQRQIVDKAMNSEARVFQKTF